jgi:hypothetical protein
LPADLSAKSMFNDRNLALGVGVYGQHLAALDEPEIRIDLILQREHMFHFVIPVEMIRDGKDDTVTVRADHVDNVRLFDRHLPP